MRNIVTMLVSAIVPSNTVPPIEWLMMLLASQHKVLQSTTRRIGKPLMVKNAIVAMQVPPTGTQAAGEDA